MVHRVGNSLLLDDFDIHKHLLRQERNDWDWLRKFFLESVAVNSQRVTLRLLLCMTGTCCK